MHGLDRCFHEADTLILQAYLGPSVTLIAILYFATKPSVAAIDFKNLLIFTFYLMINSMFLTNS